MNFSLRILLVCASLRILFSLGSIHNQPKHNKLANFGLGGTSGIPSSSSASASASASTTSAGTSAASQHIMSPKHPVSMRTSEVSNIRSSVLKVLLGTSTTVGFLGAARSQQALAASTAVGTSSCLPPPTAVGLATAAACGSSDLLSNEIIKKPNDLRAYRALTLDNGLRVLLVSDKQTSQAAAAVDVHVGSLSDPLEVPGLAHFCEHMSFLGTKKYPKEDEYGQFLSSHGGSSNAYTDSEDTVYYFDVNAGYFNESLDRFAQFFIEPTFSSSATSRELNAIDSEHAKNINNNGFRIFQLDRDMANPAHPLNRFATGNKETLETIPKSRGIDVREELLKFHSKYYTANLMTLSVLSNQDLDSLEALTRSLFSGVPNRQTADPASKWWGKVEPFLPQTAATALEIVPLDENRLISISWPIWLTSPDVRQQKQRSKPESILAHLIGHEGKGSLRSFLVTEKGWANGVNAGAASETSDMQAYEVSVSLTEEGLAHRDEVVDAIFGYIDLLKTRGIPPYIFREVAELSALAFNYSERSEPADYVSRLVSDMQSYFVPSQYLVGPRLYRYLDNSKDDVMGLLNVLVPQQARIKVIAKAFEGKTSQEGRYYGTQYNLRSLPEQTERWKRVKYQQFPMLAAPQPNVLIPQDFSLAAPPLPADATEAQRIAALDLPPTVIRKTSTWTVWHKTDTVFKQPKVYVLISLSMDIAKYNPRFLVAAKLFSACFFEKVNEYLYDARLAGLNFDMEFTSRGLQLRFTGYNDKMDLFAERIMKELEGFSPEQSAFQRNKDLYEQEFASWKTQQPYAHCSYFASLALETLQFPIDELKQALEQTTLGSLDHFLADNIDVSYGTALVVGNANTQSALKLVEGVERTLKFRPLPFERRSKRRYIEFPLASEGDGKKLGYLLARQEPNENDANSAATFYFQLPSKNVKDQVSMELLAAAIEQAFYSSLRTKQQLGYIVYSSVKFKDGYYVLSFTVQSAVVDGDELTKRIETFIEFEGLTGLAKLTDAQIEEFKEGIITQKMEPDRRLTAQAGRFWGEIILSSMNGSEDSPEQPIFDRAEREVAALKALSRTEFLAFCKDVMAPDGARRRLVVSQVTTTFKGKKATIEADTSIAGETSAASSSDRFSLKYQQIDNELEFRNKHNLL